MLKVEEKFIRWCEKNVNILFFLVVTALALAVRYVGRNQVSDDMRVCLLAWVETMGENGGLAALKEQIGDYNLLYQTILAIASYFEEYAIYPLKALDCLFEFILAFLVARMVIDATGGKLFGSKFVVAYTVVLFIPTVMLDGAYWGQCDSIYVSFVILTMYSMFKEKYVRAFVYLGIAFAFKLQTIFILPFIITYYVYKKRFSIFMFFISIFVFWLSGIVAYFNGRELSAAFTVYLNQTDACKEMYLNAPSFWVLMSNDYLVLKWFAIGLTLALLGLGFYAVITGHKSFDNIESQLNTTAWFLWVCILFLPAMHERYTFLLDIVLVILCFFNQKYIKYAVVAVVTSTMTYGGFLFANGNLEKWNVWLYLAMFVHFTYTIMKENKVEVVESGAREE